MSTLSSEFFLSNIESTRPQIYSTCWAYMITSLIGDTFSLQKNITPILPSVIWTISMRNNVCPYYRSKYNTICQTGNFSNYNVFEILQYMSKNKDKFFIKLERCFPVNETINMIITDDSSFKLSENTKFNYLGEKYFDCCMNKISYTNFLKNIFDWRKNEISEIDCIKPISEIDKLLCDFNIKVTHVFELKKINKDKKDITEIDIINRQNNLKVLLTCNLPFLTTIIITQDYKDFINNLYKNYSSSTTYFEPNTNIDDNHTYGYHAIIVYGWSRKDNKEYWIVRDSNIPIFYKIKFSDFENKNKWIGCDIDCIPIYINVESSDDKIFDKLIINGIVSTV